MKMIYSRQDNLRDDESAKSDSGGFTLIEALACLVIIAVLFLGISSIIANYTEINRVNEAHSANNRLAQMLRDRMGFEKICSVALQAANFPTAGANDARNPGLNSGLPVAIDSVALGLNPANKPETIAEGNNLNDFNLRIFRFRFVDAVQVASFPSYKGLPTSMWKVSLVMQAQAINAQGGLTILSPRWIGTFFVGASGAALRNDQYRCMNSTYEVVRACADANMIYAPLGFQTHNPALGGSDAAPIFIGADANGCVRHDAFIGDTGPIGIPGPIGGTGSAQVIIPGPIIYVPVTPAPPPPPSLPPPSPPPPKTSDIRVKSSILNFDDTGSN